MDKFPAHILDQAAKEAAEQMRLEQAAGLKYYLVAHYGPALDGHDLIDITAPGPQEAVKLAYERLPEGHTVTDVYEHVYSTPEANGSAKDDGLGDFSDHDPDQRP